MNLYYETYRYSLHRNMWDFVVHPFHNRFQTIFWSEVRKYNICNMSKETNKQSNTFITSEAAEFLGIIRFVYPCLPVWSSLYFITDIHDEAPVFCSVEFACGFLCKTDISTCWSIVWTKQDHSTLSLCVWNTSLHTVDNHHNTQCTFGTLPFKGFWYHGYLNDMSIQLQTINREQWINY